jgi:hypothetical protein
MKTKFLICAALLLASCTHNQDLRFRELLTTTSGAFPRYKDIQIASECLDSPSSQFSLHLEETPSRLVLRAEGLPVNERFIFISHNAVEGKINALYEFELKETGEFEIFDSNGVRFEKEIPFRQAEGLKAATAIEYAIVSKKTYTSAKVQFVPYPVFAEGGDIARIEILSTHAMGTHFQVNGSGFKPDESLLLVHEFGDRKEELEIAADSDGTFSIGINPTILGRLGGTAVLTIERESDNFHIDYPWGTGLEKRTTEERRTFDLCLVASPKSEDFATLSSP